MTINDVLKYTSTKVKSLMESESVGDPLTDVKMNSMVKDEKMNSSKEDVKMNSMDKEQGEKAALVMVTDKKETTKSTQPSKDSGEPFSEKGEKEMNSMDEEGDDTTKTFVKAGGTASSKQDTNKGMHKPEFSEEAKNEKEKEERIAKAIEISEGRKFSSKEELLEFCKKEAERVYKLL